MNRIVSAQPVQIVPPLPTLPDLTSTTPAPASGRRVLRIKVKDAKTAKFIESVASRIVGKGAVKVQ